MKIGNWENEKNIHSIQEELSENDANKEARLLYGNTDKYGIYQLKDNPELRQFRFEDTESLKRTGITKDNFDAIKMENYDLIRRIIRVAADTGETLEAVYEKFNIDHPADYKGHSLQLVDIVVLRSGGGKREYGTFCLIPLVLLPCGFLKEQTQALEVAPGRCAGNFWT